MKRFSRPLALLLVLPLLGCNEHDATWLGYLGLRKHESTIGDADHGLTLIAEKGCKSCHTIPGVAGADGLVGPPLTRMAKRRFIAGVLPNTPQNMMTWVRFPQRIVPGNAMPNTGLGEEDARDITAYLYTLDK